MRRVELEHVIRAAAVVAEDDPAELRRRLDDMPLAGAELDRLRRTVEGVVARAGSATS